MGWNEHLGKDAIGIFLCIRDHLKAMTELGSRSRGGRETKAVKEATTAGNMFFWKLKGKSSNPITLNYILNNSHFRFLFPSTKDWHPLLSIQRVFSVRKYLRFFSGSFSSATLKLVGHSRLSSTFFLHIEAQICM